MKKINQILSSSTGRTLSYLGIFITGSALHELLVGLINPTIRSTAAAALTLTTIGVFLLIGATVACTRNTMSRVISASTLFVLSFVALRIGHSVVPDPYLLVIALCVAAIGAQPVLHRKLASFKRTILYSLLIVFISLAVVVTFVYSLTMMDSIVIQQQYDSQN